jgi:uncharacterized membrane protein (UPF0127 family)
MLKRSWATLIIIGAICFCMPHASSGETLIVHSDKGSELCRFDVDLAVTPAEQERGLMFRKTMDDHVGMFFIFDRDEIRHFWMRNTLIPLDMIFIDNKFLVVAIHRGAKPLDETVISSRKPARYVLEVNAGKADKCRIKTGAKVKLLKSP